jgi:hypothetical protein
MYRNRSNGGRKDAKVKIEINAQCAEPPLAIATPKEETLFQWNLRHLQEAPKSANQVRMNVHDVGHQCKQRSSPAGCRSSSLGSSQDTRLERPLLPDRQIRCLQVVGQTCVFLLCS